MASKTTDNILFQAKMRDNVRLHPTLKLEGTTVSSNEKAFSSVSVGTFIQKAELFPGLCNALYCMATKKLTIVECGDETCVSEVQFRTASGTPIDKYLITQKSDNGTFSASIVVPSANAKSMVPASVEATPSVGSADMCKAGFPVEGLYAALIPGVLRAYPAVKTDLDIVLAAFEAGHDLSEGTVYTDERLALFRVNHAVQYANNEVFARNNGMGYAPPVINNNNVDTIEVSRFADRSMDGDVIYGNPSPTILNKVRVIRDPKKIRTFKDACEAFSDYRVSVEEIPEEYRKYIPEFPADYPVPENVIVMLMMARGSENFKEPFRNFLWRGETGFGKSTGAALFAAIRGLPLLRLTCSPEMEKTDFLAKFVPRGDEKARLPKLPPMDFIELDSESAYEAVTGKVKDGATPQDVLDAYTQQVQECANGNNMLLRVLDNEFITAMAYGFVCEVQELSAPKNAGVLLSINEYDRPGAIIPLVDGRKVTRSRRAIVIGTDNPGYEGTNPVNQAAIRRFGLAFDSWEMSPEETMDRVMYNTGFQDRGMLKDMYEVWTLVRKFCREHEIMEGDTSIVSLENWCRAVKCLPLNSKTLRDTCQWCVIGKATAQQEDQQAIRTAVLDTHSLFGNKSKSRK